MNSTLTVRDLLRPGEPLSSAEVVAAAQGLANRVAWAVSLRPFAPAFPRLRGGELALVATEYMQRLDPPTTLSDVIRHLASRQAAAIAVKGLIDEKAMMLAEEVALPLLSLPSDAPLHDIEQAIMRECALHQARSEVLPQGDVSKVLGALLEGGGGTIAEKQAQARRSGITLEPAYFIAYLSFASQKGGDAIQIVEQLEEASRVGGWSFLAHTYDDGLAVLLPPSDHETILQVIDSLRKSQRLGVGVAVERPLNGLAASVEEARVAALASELLYNGAATWYGSLGADHLLILLYRDQPAELRGYVDRTLGPLIRHDARAASPLLPTLRAFVEHGGHLRETATHLYVHRNTLAYRLDRVAQILGTDIKSGNARFAIEIALRAQKLVAASD